MAQGSIGREQVTNGACGATRRDATSRGGPFRGLRPVGVSSSFVGEAGAMTRISLEKVTGICALGPVVLSWAQFPLWMVGDQRYKVQTLLTPLERRLTYTNDAIDPAV